MTPDRPSQSPPFGTASHGDNGNIFSILFQALSCPSTRNQSYRDMKRPTKFKSDICNKKHIKYQEFYTNNYEKCNKSSLIILTYIILSLSSTLKISEAAAQTWLCIAESSGGLAWRENHWSGTSFIADGKFLLKQIDFSDSAVAVWADSQIEDLNTPDRFRYQYILVKFGASGVDEVLNRQICSERTTRNDAHYIVCTSNLKAAVLVSSFQLDLQTNQFIYVDPGTVALKYKGQTKSENDDAVMRQGSCSKI